MTATGRLMFLLLVTGLFVQVWSEDSRQAAERRVARLRTHKAHVVVQRMPERLPLLRYNIAVNSPIEKAQSESLPPQTWRLASCPCPLPTHLTAGTYRVVDNVGQVGLLDVTNEELAFLGLPTDVTSLDIYSQTSGTTQWYFIRLKSAATGATTVAVESNDVPVVITNLPDTERRRFNRKFDFTGYR
ncbi:MAG: hypothetical protein HZA46_11765 [Planctomycetales bacterium]|nr:hypothetical protein [Planctomycetales bacterium]